MSQSTCPVKRSNSVATAVLANIDEAVTTLQDILPMPIFANLTAKSPPTAMEYSLELAGMFTLMILLEPSMDLTYPAPSFERWEVN